MYQNFRPFEGVLTLINTRYVDTRTALRFESRSFENGRLAYIWRLKKATGEILVWFESARLGELINLGLSSF